MAHVLIIEDDADTRDMLDLDLMMPVMSGWQFREAQLADRRVRRNRLQQHGHK